MPQSEVPEQSEQKLALSEESLRLSNEAGEVGLWDLDLTTGVLTWSDRTRAMFGISPGVTCDMEDFYAGLHPEDRDETAVVFAAAVDPAQRTIYDVEYRTIGKEDGRTRWVAAKGRGLFDAGGACVRAIGTAIDITARRQSELRQAALLQLGDKLRNLSAPDEMAYAAAEVLGRTLLASRAGYRAYHAASGDVLAERDWAVPGSPGVTGTRDFREYGSFLDDLLRGEAASIADVMADPRTRAHAAAWGAIDVRALLAVPVMEGGRLVALFFANDREVRNWTAGEATFARDVAERTRTTVERRRAEAALRALNVTLEAQVAARTSDRDQVWKNSRDLLAVVGLDGLLHAVNPAWTAILGHEALEVVGRSVIDFVAPEDEAAMSDALVRIAGGEDLADFQNRYLHRDGTLRWLSWRTTCEGDMVYAFGRHITEEREAQKALAQSLARQRAAFETSFQLQSLLAPDGTVLDCNRTALRVIGQELADVAGQKFWDTPWFAATPGMPDVVRAAVAAAAGGTDVWQELTVNVPSGMRSYEFSMRAVRVASGEVVALLPEAVDITERRAAEDALRQSQKMEAVGQLTGGIAHDFNNLLTGITGSLELLRKRLAQGRVDAADRYIGAAEGAAKRAAALTQRLLAFSRRQTLDPLPTNANRLLAGMEELIRRTVGPAVALEVVGAGGLWTTLVDRNQLENAVLNLCINARDAMPDGGRITIETANKWLDDRAAGERELPPGQYVSVCVTDTGTGMTPEVIARAFDPFFTTKPLGAGTGLGLSMIYGFVRQSGGQVRVYSELASGTTMCMYLPRHLSEAEDFDTAGPGRQAVSQGSGETVLLVDDERTVRMLVAEVLREAGYAIIEVQDGAAGLRVLQSAARIDLLITDVGLPGGVNGRQVADAGRALRPGLKVLFITGYAENAVIGNGHLESGMAVLTKPFAMDALAEKVGDILER